MPPQLHTAGATSWQGPKGNAMASSTSHPCSLGSGREYTHPSSGHRHRDGKGEAGSDNATAQRSRGQGAVQPDHVPRHGQGERACKCSGREASRKGTILLPHGPLAQQSPAQRVPAVNRAIGRAALAACLCLGGEPGQERRRWPAGE